MALYAVLGANDEDTYLLVAGERTHCGRVVDRLEGHVGQFVFVTYLANAPPTGIFIACLHDARAPRHFLLLFSSFFIF